ncbi:MAG TPA: energy-coupling factor transporter transmembrane protein EcfT [Anaerolineales bacterium]|nr:energy-coupling factor transporter transmembrane protein EcfT [Anaerolineae bacterium]HIQ01314.1 energy-coupling factor transporter transmembrane protein EcfT [Anaerolineales bacterium]
MLIAWRYRERNTIIQRLDPRARLIFMLAVLFSIIQFWDLRIMLLFLGVGVLQYGLARLTWRETRRAWILISIIILLMTTLTFFTGRGGVEYTYHEEHLIRRLGPLSLPIVGWQISVDITAEKTIFAISQLVRMYAITIMALTIPYTIDPSLYGVTFRGLGLPDKFAYAMDLAFRFVPTLGRDFSITLDSQRARGYEVERLTGGIVAQIRRLAPLLVPVTINAIVGAEDIIDAMDLRAFGIGPRTWVHRLTYRRADYALIAASALIFVGSTVLAFMGVGGLWVPEMLLRLAAGS